MCDHTPDTMITDTEYKLGIIHPFGSLVGYNAPKMLEITILSKKKQQHTQTDSIKVRGFISYYS